MRMVKTLRSFAVAKTFPQKEQLGTLRHVQYFRHLFGSLVLFPSTKLSSHANHAYTYNSVPVFAARNPTIKLGLALGRWCMCDCWTAKSLFNDQRPPLRVTLIHGQRPTHVRGILVPTPIVSSSTRDLLPASHELGRLILPSAHPLLVPCTLIACPSSPPLSRVSSPSRTVGTQTVRHI